MSVNVMKMSNVMKNKRIDHISKTSKRNDIFAQNYTIFLLNTGKTGKMPEFEFSKF